MDDSYMLCEEIVSDALMEGLASVISNGKSGYIDKKGNWYDEKPINLQEKSCVIRMMILT